MVSCKSKKVYLCTQQDVDDFGTLKCTVILGGRKRSAFVAIGSSSKCKGIRNNITQVSALASIVKVEGTLSIEGNSALTSLLGLSNLKAGDLRIVDNANLRSLAGLENLAEVEEFRIDKNGALTNLEGLAKLGKVGDLRIVENANLTSLAGLETLVEVSRSFDIVNNGALTNLEGLTKLEKAGSLSILANANLTSLAGLENLVEVKKGFEIQKNGALTNLEGLPNLEKAGYLRILDNANLRSLAGLQNLAEVSNSFDIEYNGNLRSLAGLETLVEVGGWFVIAENGALTNIEGLTKLEKARKLKIMGNAKLTSLAGLETLVEVRVSFDIVKNGALTNLEGLTKLEKTRSLSILDNANLRSLVGLENLVKVSYSFDIKNNGALTNLEGLAKLEKAGKFEISENANLTSLAGLENLAEVEERFEIVRNGALTNLEGLANLEKAGYLRILDNANLRSLAGLQNLAEVQESIAIEKNGALTNLEGLPNLGKAGSLRILDNANLTSLAGLENLIEIRNTYGVKSYTVTERTSFFTITNNSKLTSLVALEKLNVSANDVKIEDNCMLIEEEHILPKIAKWKEQCSKQQIPPCSFLVRRNGRKACQSGYQNIRHDSGFASCLPCTGLTYSTKPASDTCDVCLLPSFPSVDHKRCTNIFFIAMLIVLAALAGGCLFRSLLKKHCSNRLRKKLDRLTKQNHGTAKLEGAFEVELSVMQASAGPEIAEKDIYEHPSQQFDMAHGAEIVEYVQVFKSARRYGLKEVAEEALSSFEDKHMSQRSECIVEEAKCIRRFKTRAEALRCAELVKRMDHRLEDAKERSEMLGIQLQYVLYGFEADARSRMAEFEWRQEVQKENALPYTIFSFIQQYKGSPESPPAQWLSAAKVAPPQDPNFVQLAPIIAYGERGLGYDKPCPRDGKPHCSITDGVNAQGRSGSANRFLSWVWTYPMSIAISALRRWAEEERSLISDFDAADINVWWCFFCNNQFRLLQDMNTQSTETLAKVFGERLCEVGKMLVLMDSLSESKYCRRIWCIFEIFVASKKEISCTVILPDIAVEKCAKIQTIEDLFEACDVNAEEAEATMPEDEKGIKDLIIKEHNGFSRVNKLVQNSLLICIFHALRAMREHRRARHDLVFV